MEGRKPPNDGQPSVDHQAQQEGNHEQGENGGKHQAADDDSTQSAIQFTTRAGSQDQGQQDRPPEDKPAPRKPADESKRRNRRRAASPAKPAAGQGPSADDFNPLAMSDEEFERQFDSTLM